ncbi:hypothetical protein, partial [Neisseria meningitidis]|uniref:hypothetical protein n=1 Tax=Neisseria meningitidis TaxID=487 RepID=UPI001C5FFC6F
GIKVKQARRAVCQPFTKSAKRIKNELSNFHFRIFCLAQFFNFINFLFLKLKKKFGSRLRPDLKLRSRISLNIK